MTLLKVTEENFIGLDPQILLDSKWYQDVENMVISIEAAATPDYAKGYLRALFDKLSKIGEQMPKELFNRYLKLFLALKLLSLNVLSDDQKEKFFREEFVDVFKFDFLDVNHWVHYLLRTYWDSPDIISDLRQIMIRGLESNVQRIGVQDLVISGMEQPLHPNIGNWLRDYRGFIQFGKNKQTRSSLDQLTYINQSANAKGLTPDLKNVLLKILKIYDWLCFESLNLVKESEKFLVDERQSSTPAPVVSSIPRPIITPAAPKATIVPPWPPVAPVVPMAPKSPVVPIVPKPQPKPSAPPQPTEFEKKLSQVSAPVPHGADLEVLKHKIEENKVSFSSKKQQEGGVKTESGGKPKYADETANEIKREVMTKELPSPETAPVKPIPVPVPKPVEIKKPKIEISEEYIAPLPEKPRNPFEGGRWDTPKASGSISEAHTPVPEAVSSTTLKRLSDIASVEDLKLVDIAHLKQGPINSQVELIRSKILNVIKQKNVLLFYGVSAFEQSPLFKAYLKVGTEMIGNNSVDRAEAFREIASRVGSNLTLEEFEAVADLRKQVERL